MIGYVQTILRGQFEASLAMLRQCIQACPPEHFEGKIAHDSFRTIAYHTMFFVDYYLSPNQDAFELRELHERGGNELTNQDPNPGLSQEETLSYVGICHQKALDILGAETAESLEGPSGFSRLPFTRGELHLYNIRHMQHHAGAMSAYLRRVDSRLKASPDLRWVRSGWR